MAGGPGRGRLSEAKLSSGVRQAKVGVGAGGLLPALQLAGISSASGLIAQRRYRPRAGARQVLARCLGRQGPAEYLR